MNAAVEVLEKVSWILVKEMLMIDVTLLPVNDLQSADVTSSPQLSSLGTTVEEVLRTELEVG